MFKYVDADYYGYRDDEDGILIELESKQEKLAIEKALQEGAWKKRERTPEVATAALFAPDEDSTETAPIKKAKIEVEAPLFKEQSDIPSQDEIKKYLLERKKQMLLSKYVSDELSTQDEETKSLTGRK